MANQTQRQMITSFIHRYFKRIDHDKGLIDIELFDENEVVFAGNLSFTLLGTVTALSTWTSKPSIHKKWEASSGMKKNVNDLKIHDCTTMNQAIECLEGQITIKFSGGI